MIKLGLIGKSLSHSFSKSFFEDYFQENKIEGTYDNIELSDIEDVKHILNDNYQGFNVTIPYKETIIPFLDEVDELAQSIGAVNVVYKKDNRWIGSNTDAYGFAQSIKPFLAFQHERAIIFGTGGASKAIAYHLNSIGIDVIYVSREPIGENQFSYDEVNNYMLDACKLLVNCTPVGTYPNVEDCIDIPFDFLTPEHLVVDLIYNPSETAFLHKAENKQAMILNGSSMLKHQALKAWSIWSEVNG